MSMAQSSTFPATAAASPAGSQPPFASALAKAPANSIRHLSRQARRSGSLAGNAPSAAFPVHFNWHALALPAAFCLAAAHFCAGLGLAVAVLGSIRAATIQAVATRRAVPFIG